MMDPIPENINLTIVIPSLKSQFLCYLSANDNDLQRKNPYHHIGTAVTPPLLIP